MNFLGSFVLNLVVVTLGVLIALIIDNWKEKRRNQSILNKALRIVRDELSKNRAEVSKAIEMHRKLLDKLRSDEPNGAQTLNEYLTQKIEGGKLLLPAIKRGAGIRYFIEKHADLMDQELIFYLSDIEIVNNYFDKKVDILMDHIFDKWESRSPHDKSKFAVLLENLISNEDQLLKLYDWFLSEKTA